MVYSILSFNASSFKTIGGRIHQLIGTLQVILLCTGSALTFGAVRRGNRGQRGIEAASSSAVAFAMTHD
jgi:hypothetical protein